MLFFLLINVKMPTTVGILTFMSRKIFSSAKHEIFYNQGTWFFTVCQCPVYETLSINGLTYIKSYITPSLVHNGFSNGCMDRLKENKIILTAHS